MVDERRLVRLLQRVTNELAYLQARAGDDPGTQATRWLDAHPG